MADKPAEPIVFPCPKCTRFIAVDPADRAKVRPIGGHKDTPLLLQVTCPACGRSILRTISR
jgi:hypothetical protein